MSGNQNKVLRLVTSPSETAGFLSQGLVDLYKAVKGAAFYPHGHPYRSEPVQRAYQSLQLAVAERELIVNVTRQGFLPGGEGPEGGTMVQQLAHECLIRRIASITFMRDLLLADLEIFVELLCGDPHKTSSAGGFARQLELQGVRTIWVNEKDLDAIWAKRGKAAAGEPSDTETDDWEGLGAPAGQAESLGIWERRSVRELLRRMAGETEDGRYQALGRELVESVKDMPTEVPVPVVLEELLRQHRDQGRPLPQREYALFTLERVAENSTDLLLDLVESRDYPDKNLLYRIFGVLGVKGAYSIIQRLCLAEGVMERKALATALVRLGQPAVAPLIAMLKDQRWYVVRNMVAILGELRVADSVIALRKPLHHWDLRVRKEAVRALMKIGGEPAEAMLVALLEDSDEAVVKSAILSLGLMHSRVAVPAMLKLLERRDFLLKTLSVKKDLVAALGRIGDRRATPHLVKILKSRGWTVIGKWHELRAAAAAALGAMREESALPLLTSLAGGEGELAYACREAIDAMERITGEGQ
ncbi:HEAT repeat domain-containing protein [Geomonas sp.]|uniref:HEAT repeat domain-containing protein n=1 Tax=Geomonas sp. TaxID=2651584 RepID=UPI002B48A598|nr:HEAT repeat domain-containing protein [Geomonas sp.]HJV33432.1 HEAT repeat domain-containing protein [Geomonas sp.]